LTILSIGECDLPEGTTCPVQIPMYDCNGTAFDGDCECDMGHWLCATPLPYCPEAGTGDGGLSEAAGD
jgi:hypothetical protein